MKHTFGGSGNKRLLSQYTKNQTAQRKADGGAISKERQDYAAKKDSEAKDAGAKGAGAALATGMGIGMLGAKGRIGKAIGAIAGSGGGYETAKQGLARRDADQEAKWARSGMAEPGKEDRAQGGRVKGK